MEPRIYTAPNGGPFTLDGSRTYLVGRRRVAVIDPGPDVEDHVRALSHALQRAERVTILLTHGHSDHSGGAPALARTLGAPIRAFPGYKLASETGLRVENLSEGDHILTDEGELRTLSVPGHSREHLAFQWVEADALFVGDLILGRGHTTWVGEYQGCVGDYLRSLDKVEGLDVSVLYPGHGPPITDPGAAVGAFRRHRMRRLEQVRRARSRSPEATPEELAAVIYGRAVPEPVAKAAADGVRAALHYLDLETGRA